MNKERNEKNSSVTFVFDVETDGLKPSVVHCMALQCVETGDSFICADQPGYIPLPTGLELLKEADWLIAHNGLDYDVPVLERLYRGFRVERGRLIDTLPLARSFFPDIFSSDQDRRFPELPSKLWGRHSLEAWGYRLGVRKGIFGHTTNWRHFSREMADYCELDVKVTLALYELLSLAAVGEDRRSRRNGK